MLQTARARYTDALSEGMALAWKGGVVFVKGIVMGIDYCNY